MVNKINAKKAVISEKAGMNKRVLCAEFFAIFLVAFLLFFAFGSAAAPVQQSVPPQQQKTALTPVAEIGQQIQALVTGGETIDAEPQETFGTRALGVLLTFFNLLGSEGTNLFGHTVFSELRGWYAQQLENPVLYERWVLIFQRLALVIGFSLLAGWITDLVLLPVRKIVYRKNSGTLSSKVKTLSVWMLLALMPILAYLGVALFLMSQGDPPKVARFVVMTVVYAVALLHVINLVVRFFFAPKYQELRLLPVSTEQAVSVKKWIAWYSIVMIFGYFSLDVAQLMKMPPSAISVFSSVVGFVVVLMTIFLIALKRAAVSSFLRGELSAAQRGLTLWESIRLWLARSWHVLAIAYLVVGYAVTTLSADGGFAIMQRGTILTILALFLMRMGYYVTHRIFRKSEGEKDSSGIYRPVFKYLFRMAIWILTVAAIAAAWGADVGGMVASAWGQRVMGSLFSIASTVVIVVGIYEILHKYIRKKLDPRDNSGKTLQPNARALTLLPMIRNVAVILLSIIVGLVVLSEMGINIAPMLAGAGVIGVAIGFGSQALVKDFITGLFMILEDNIAVGDIVSIGEHSGEVESISIRTLRLRDAKGSVHILPFGEITKIINMSKGFSYALMDIGVAYSSDLRKVMKVMAEVGEELRKSPEIGDNIIAPPNVQGVDNFADSSITVRCRLKTKPGTQWDVKRAYLLLLKERFDKENIQIPFPTVMHIQQAE